MFKEILIDISRRLQKSQIPYIVVGGQAVLLYGDPRMTRDIDITLGVDIDQLARVTDAVNDLPFSILARDFEAFVRSTRVLPIEHRESGIRIDLIFSFSPYEQLAIARARIMDLDGTSVSYASPEDIIVHKMVAGRPRDLEDIKGILIRQTGLDQEYVRQWLSSFEDVVGRKLVEEYSTMKEALK